MSVTGKHVEPVILAADRVDTDRLLDAFNHSFRDYVAGRIQLRREGFEAFVRSQGIELGLSRVAVCEGRIAGHAFIGRFGGLARLSGMGVVPEYRRQGVAAQLLRITMDEARRRGDDGYSLEVFEQNPGAVALYEQCGLKRRRRLYGYSRHPLFRARVPGVTPQRLDPQQLATELIAQDRRNLPFQYSGYFLRCVPGHHDAFGYRTARIAVTDVNQKTVLVRVLIDHDPEQMRCAVDLLRKLLSTYPKRTWKISALVPEEIGTGAFEPAGFNRDPLNQFQMDCRF